MEVSARRGRLQTEDLLYLIRNVRVQDRQKLIHLLCCSLNCVLE